MINVTYILGAGFSAPAGVPVMGNFISMSKDLYFSDPNRYSYFKSVFAKIDRLSKIKSYFNADLFNIEEVLSILETERQLIKATKANREFVSLITDVLNHYTPPLANFAPERPANWEDFIFGRHMPEKLYAAFFASMFGLLFSRRSDNDRGLRIENFDDHRGYSIVTLNYDLLPERFEQLLAKYFAGGETIHFQRDRYDETDYLPHLAKIHGSSDSKDIIPPTWAKIQPQS